MSIVGRNTIRDEKWICLGIISLILYPMLYEIHIEKSRKFYFGEEAETEMFDL